MTCMGLVEVPLPVGRHRAGGARDGLLDGMAVWSSEGRAVEELAGAEVKEPVLAGLKALQHGMACRLVVGAGMPARRVIATANMAAQCTTAQVQPPPRSLVGEALHAAGPTGRSARIDISW